jgi:hypothetical protein
MLPQMLLETTRISYLMKIKTKILLNRTPIHNSNSKQWQYI